MTAVVLVMVSARADLVRLLERRGLATLDALVTASVFLDDIEQQFQRHGTPPPEATVLPRDPDGNWWYYTNGMWIGYTTDDSTHGLFRRRTRTVTLVSAVARPPRP